MKYLFAFFFILLSCISCDVNKEKREKLAENLYMIRQEKQNLEKSLDDLNTNFLSQAEQSINQLETDERRQLEREEESVYSFQFGRTPEEKENDIARYNEHYREYMANLQLANEYKQQVLGKIKQKKDSVEMYIELEMEYQKQLDIIK